MWFATFRVSAEVSPNKQLTIHYIVSGDSSESSDSNFLTPTQLGEQNKILNFSLNVTSVNLTIPLINDNNMEDDGVIVVTIIDDKNKSGLTYTVGTQNIAKIDVIDDDSLPIVSVMADCGDVAESSGKAKFFIIASGVSQYDTLNINATPAEIDGDFLTNSVANSPTSFLVDFSVSIL